MRQVTLIGMGPGSRGMLTIDAAAAVEQADLLIGAKRLLDQFADAAFDALSDAKLHPNPRVKTLAAYQPQQILARLQQSDWENACLLFTGDLGFYSGATKLLQLLREQDFALWVLPGVSSVQYFASCLQMPWEDWKLVSAHGVDCDPVAAVGQGKTLFLTDTKSTPDALCRRLIQAGYGDLTVSIGENLSYPNQRVQTITVSEAAEQSFAPLAVMLLYSDAENAPSPDWFGLPDEMFLRGKVPMTKSEVRAVALSKLRLCKNSVVWDVGAGTGSVSVEAARRAPNGRVYAIECKEDALNLIAQNSARFGCRNLSIICGKAPEACESLESPDAVFVGGSSGNLEGILRLALAKNPAVRMVISCVTAETVSAAFEAVKRLSMPEPEVIQLAVTKFEPVGSYHMMRAQNPVTIFAIGGKCDEKSE